MKNLKKTTNKLNKLIVLTKESKETLLNRVGSHLLKELNRIQKKESENSELKLTSFKNDFSNRVDYHPTITKRTTIIEEFDVAR